MMSNVIIKPTENLQGCISVPGDKSISHRALLFGAIANGQTHITGASTAADVQSTRTCLQALGVDITDQKGEIIVDGAGLKGLESTNKTLDAGNSGTTIRLLSGILAGQHFPSTITGDESLCKRPMKRIIEPLMEIGADVKSQDGYPPLTIHGGDLCAIEYKIPVASAVHSSFHIASLIGERFSVIHPHTTSALTVRHCAERYGLSHKLASVRCYGHSSTYIYGFLSKYKDNKEERIKIPEVKKIIGDMTTHCVAAVEKDRVDSLILTCEAFETFEGEVRRRLDEAGYNEIPIISCFSAAVEVAKAMVNLRLVQTSRAYPSATLKVTPEYW